MTPQLLFCAGHKGYFDACFRTPAGEDILFIQRRPEEIASALERRTGLKMDRQTLYKSLMTGSARGRS